jgi:hypothetical protein
MKKKMKDKAKYHFIQFKLEAIFYNSTICGTIHLLKRKIEKM